MTSSPPGSPARSSPRRPRKLQRSLQLEVMHVELSRAAAQVVFLQIYVNPDRAVVLEQIRACERHGPGRPGRLSALSVFL